jgi:uncharacterized coiled-coil protein SlyX
MQNSRVPADWRRRDLLSTSFSRTSRRNYRRKTKGDTGNQRPNTFQLRNSTLMKTKIPSFLITLLIACLELSQNAQAVTPSPDGGYPGRNTAEGEDALFSLTDGTFNSAIGWRSLRGNTGGDFNTAIGAAALLSNTNATENTATGAGALLSNAAPLVSGGNGNTANGAFALFHNTSGSLNTATGDRALFNNTTGSNNIALGDSAGSAVTTASHVICIGTAGANTSNSCYIANIYSRVQPPVGDVANVTIDSSSRLGRGNVSSHRYKHDIHPMDKASEAIFALKPVSFRYKKEYDPTQTIAFGLIAEEVAETNPDLVGRDDKGEPESVRYEQINAMLLNEFLKEHRKVQEQETTIAELKSDAAKQQATISQLKNGIETVVARLKEQDAKIQQVSDQVEMSNGVAHVVVSHR